MARTQAKTLTSIWLDPDWRALTRTAQGVYHQILSQPNLTIAGCIDLMPARWAKGCAGDTTESVETDLAELEQARFVVIDDDELVIRSFTKNDLAVGALNVNLVKGFWSAWLGIRSPVLRKVIVDNLPDKVWDRCPDDVPDQAKELRSEPLLELPLRPQSEPSVDLLSATCSPLSADCSPSGVSEIPSTRPEQIAETPPLDLEQEARRAIHVYARAKAAADPLTVDVDRVAHAIGNAARSDGRADQLRALVVAGATAEEASDSLLAPPPPGRSNVDPAEAERARERTEAKRLATIAAAEKERAAMRGDHAAGLEAARAARMGAAS